MKLSCGPVNIITVSGQRAVLPAFLPMTGWSLHNKGYLIYTSRRKNGLRRGTRAHRAVVEHTLGRTLTADEIIHHMDHDKLNCCCCNLLRTTTEFNPTGALRCPATGRYMTADEWQRTYGYSLRTKENDIPDWVTQNETEEETSLYTIA